MLGRALAGAVLLLGLLLGAPAPPAPAADCTGAACGVPQCWQTSVRARPAMSRALTVQCRGAVSAKLVQAPEHSAITDVTVADWYGIRFTILPDEDAPRYEEAVFEVGGHEGSVELRLQVETVPLAENSPPTCYGTRHTERSDGKGPVEVYLHPHCYDPDGDEFVMDGGGPGVHPQAPKSIPAGEGDSNWPYRTATHAGTETTTLWGTDVLGARSDVATLEVTVGPDIDRLPECHPNPSMWDGSGVFPVYTRPGAVRRFALICEDLDGDKLTSRVSTPPKNGTVALVVPREPDSGWWGMHQWNDSTYAPTNTSLEPDEFGMVASGDRGDGPETRIRLIPRELPANSGGSCGYSPLQVSEGKPGVLEFGCDDDDGDALSAEVVGGPLHGTAAPALTTPGLYGSTRISIAYVPEPGFAGTDCVTVVVSDGNGLRFELPIDIYVSKQPVWNPTPPPLPDLPPLPQLPPPIPLPYPSPVNGATPTKAAAPASPNAVQAELRTLVEAALGTGAVTQLPAAKPSQVWAPGKLSRRTLLREGQAPALIAVCPDGCELKSRSELYTGSRTRARASRRETVQVLEGGQAQAVWLIVDEEQRAGLRRARKPRVTFTLTLRSPGAKPRTIKRSIRIAR